MHWICDSLMARGWHVRFVTCDFSYVTRVRGDRRTATGRIVGLNSLTTVSKSLSLAVIQTFLHPMGHQRGLIGRILDAATAVYPWPRGRLVSELAAGTDLVIVESCGALMMIDIIRKATSAPIVYRVSDNIEVIRPVPSLLLAEKKAAAMVDAISLASEKLAARFRPLGVVRIDPMGIDKSVFDRANVNPYGNDLRTKVVISGSSGLDVKSLAIAANAKPDWLFVQFGSAKNIPRMENILAMGEVPFSEMVPWVKFADIGFAPYLVKPGFEYQAEHSNRLLQYTYCGLPSVVPRELTSSSRQHFVGYIAGEIASISSALDFAANFDKGNVPRDSVETWDDLAGRLTSIGLRARVKSTVTD